MCLICKAGFGGYRGERSGSCRDSHKCFPRPRFRTKRCRRDAKYGLDSSRKCFWGEALAVRPVAKNQLWICDQIGRENVGPVRRRRGHRNQLFVKMKQGGCHVCLSRSGDCVSVSQAGRAAGNITLECRNDEVQNSCVFCTKTVEMRLETTMNYDITGANVKAPEA